MIKYNLLLVTVFPNKKIEKLQYYVDFSVYNTVESLNNHITSTVGKDIVEHYNIFYFYNGNILTEKEEIADFDKTIMAYVVSKTSSTPTGYNIINSSVGFLSDIFARLVNNDVDSDDHNDEELDNDNEQAVNDIDFNDIFNKYQDQYLAMIGMGFNDENRVSMSLQVTNGDIDHAVNYYLSSAD